MFTIRYFTQAHEPDESVTLRSNWTGWQVPVAGVFEQGAWIFRLDENDGAGEFLYTFVLEGVTWRNGGNLAVPVPTGGLVVDLDDDDVTFTAAPAVVTENGRVQQLVFPPNLDPEHEYDVIVVGSGMGGGVLADQLADAGKDVLVLEVGSYLFPTHVGNLPRRLRIGKFDKHVWGLWQDFKTVNYQNVGGSTFGGGQGFNLGGRSVFWGGLIPRMGAWELEGWPASIRDYLTSTGYRLAEDTLNKTGPLGSPFQERVKSRLGELLPDYAHFDAPVAVQYQGYTPAALPGGMFSTADLLAEDRLVDDPGRAKVTINLNHAVQRVLIEGTRAVGVECYDLLGGRQRTYKAGTVVLSAGTIESAKIALQSGLANPSGLIGRGITDHPIWFTHFALPAGSPFADPDASAKVWSRHQTVTTTEHAFNVVLELGADFNQGRYIDPDNLQRQKDLKDGSILCEIVVLFNAPLMDANNIAVAGDPSLPVLIDMRPAPITEALQQEARAVAATVLAGLGAVPIDGGTLDLVAAGLGGVAHEVGTLRTGDGITSVVDDALKFVGYDNLYACDNSVFASSPAANPSLTLVALANRLAARLAAL